MRDPEPAERTPARREDLEKLAVSWNLGLGNYVCRENQIVARMGKLDWYWPFPSYRWSATPAAAAERPIDISFRGRLRYHRDTVSYQRVETARLLSEFENESGCATAPRNKLPYREYRHEMRRSKVVLSPFGFGEINVGRDLECFIDGALLVKPDMSHMETWPDLFVPGVTYVPYRWDFADLKDVLRRALAHRPDALRIAAAGQARYVAALGSEGGEAFADHLAALLRRAMAASR